MPPRILDPLSFSVGDDAANILMRTAVSGDDDVGYDDGVGASILDPRSARGER